MDVVPSSIKNDPASHSDGSSTLRFNTTIWSLIFECCKGAPTSSM
jgi:hypothetical protein